MKEEEIERADVYFERIHKLTHVLQVLTTNNLLTIVFKASLQSYFKITTTWMKWSTLQHKEVAMLCEERMNIVEARNALLLPHSTKHATITKT